jgi:hypothetical protein
MLRLAAAVFFLFRVALLPAAPVNPQELFDEIRRNVVHTLKNAPRYTCQESIQRQWYDRSSLLGPGCPGSDISLDNRFQPVMSDRIRFDVGIVGGQEMFSWHGGNSFATDRIDDVVVTGPVSSGTFYTFLLTIFAEGRGHFQYRGVRVEKGHTLALFNFEVPRKMSAYMVRSSGASAIAGYHGTFTADLSSASLQSLNVIVDELDPSLEICRFNLDFEYRNTTFGESPFITPSSVQMTGVYPSHQISSSRTSYIDCHQFVGESVVHFDDVPVADTATRKARNVQDLPSGLQLSIRLTSKLAPDRSWGGDAIDGELDQPLKDKKGRVLAPAGTRISGRLIEFSQHYGPEVNYTVGLQFDNLHTAESDYRVKLRPRSGPQSKRWRKTSAAFVNTIELKQRNVGVFTFPAKDFHFANSLVSDWVSERR